MNVKDLHSPWPLALVFHNTAKGGLLRSLGIQVSLDCVDRQENTISLQSLSFWDLNSQSYTQRLTFPESLDYWSELSPKCEHGLRTPQLLKVIRVPEVMKSKIPFPRSGTLPCSNKKYWLEIHAIIQEISYLTLSTNQKDNIVPIKVGQYSLGQDRCYLQVQVCWDRSPNQKSPGLSIKSTRPVH